VTVVNQKHLTVKEQLAKSV